MHLFSSKTNPDGAMRRAICAALIAGLILTAAASRAADPATDQLARELATRGWILFSAKTPKGDYDLFLARPDGSGVRNLTQTPQFSEFGGRFSPDSQKMLYRRTRAGVSFNHDLWGATGALILANVDGSSPEPQGVDGGFPWATWSPDMRQLCCLYKKDGKIRIFDWPSKRLIKELPRQGIFQQFYLGPDGKHVCGTANVQGQDWKILSLDLDTGKSTLVSRNLSCTPDWFQKDSSRIVYSCRIPGLETDYGWTMLMQGTADGKERTLIYGERGKHIYYGCTSPDDQYVIFAVPESDGGIDAYMAIVRLGDTPIVAPEDYESLKSLYPKARNGPVLHLTLAGFEPHWTYADVEGK